MNPLYIQEILKRMEFPPYGHYVPLIGKEAVLRYAESQIQGFCDNGKTVHAISADDSGAFKGFCSWQESGWDSQMLGRKTGRINAIVVEKSNPGYRREMRNLLDKAEKGAVDKGIDYFFTRVHSSDLDTLYLLENNGYITVDGLVTFSLDLRRTVVKNGSTTYEIRTATAEDAEAVASIAGESYIYDRFHSDPALSKETSDELHRCWLRNSCKGIAADAVLLACRNDRIAAYATVKIDAVSQNCWPGGAGHIVLVAAARTSRNEGAASAASHAAIRWCREHGVRFVEVGTQFRNIPATRLYQKLGFLIISTSYSLRKCLLTEKR